MGHTFASVERRRAELREKLEELRPQLTKLHAADIELQRQVGLARRDDRREDERAFAAQRQAGQPAIVELSGLLSAISEEDDALVKAKQELRGEADRLLATMTARLAPYLALCVTGPDEIERDIAPLRERYRAIIG